MFLTKISAKALDEHSKKMIGGLMELALKQNKSSTGQEGAKCGNLKKEFLHVRDVAQKLGKSESWVYNNKEELGFKKIGGSWISTQEGLNHALQGKETLESKGYIPKKAVHKKMQNQSRSQRMGKRKTKGTKIPKDSDPYGLLT